MLLALYTIFIYAPVEKTMGILQKIFYIHVPSAFLAYLAFFITFVASILYLYRKDSKWDTVAHCAVETGVIFCAIVLITGPIWAKPIWNVWWTWDPRLTTTLILWFTYVAYPAGKFIGRLRYYRFYQRPDYIFLDPTVANDPPGNYHQPGIQHVGTDENFPGDNLYRFLFFIFLHPGEQDQFGAVKAACRRAL
jgi:ABC-type transport system involved in cytochrome c biogenesis permease subunit